MPRNIPAIITTLFVLILLLPCTGNTRAWTEQQDYIRNPVKIPSLANFSTPTIEPGFTDSVAFSITNRYNDSFDKAYLTIQLYALGTIDYEKKITDVRNPPRICENVPNKTPNKNNPQSLTLVINRLAAGATLNKSFSIRTYTDTEEGTYSVRFNLTFEFQNVKYTMLSLGYFSMDDWRWAIANFDNEGTKINMTYLYAKYGAIAMVPDTSFAVKRPIPLWPLIALGGVSGSFAGLAVVFYLQEEHGKFPRLEKTLQKWTGKFYQSRRLMKKRARKVRRKV